MTRDAGREAVVAARLKRRRRTRGPAPRRGAKRTVLAVILELPNYLRLLWGLMADARVSTVDKLLVGGAIVYILLPLDLIPDPIPFLGQVDDVYLLVLALQRLIVRAGPRVVMDHWSGDPAALTSRRLRQVLLAASFFLPRRIRRRLRRLGR
ncbi:MAG TPA: YkvA family protein [Gemmatimonadaceae bacterium]|nr:YkvA family protein [Gemmatimonadaceae bacterium]